ncbi:flagellar hook-basal body complex protein [Sedimentibacter sp.]|uniref:flagellar hook-basal body protein n=1 Tax=Sedimentibacter sp. TaxID=1960295 RepID=UPI00289AF280|nr:flagellar hook-basal body complex protein [Sedimentibacter sp.]
MMKALYSGVSGMRSHQTKMDVIGNNIANVNTNGYKAQRTTFRDVYYQQIKNPTEPGNVGGVIRGGTNSGQVGYGAQVGSIDTMHTISGYSPTNRSTDIYINGEGYLTVQTSNGDTLYTRLGALGFDEAGNLVDVNGSSVMGWNVSGYTGTNYDPTYVGKAVPPAVSTVGPLTIKEFDNFKNITVNEDGTITGTTKEAMTTPGTVPKDTVVIIGQIAIANIPNNNALVLEGNSYYRAGNNTGNITYEEAGTQGTGGLVTYGLEMSNVDLANEFSDMIITQRGYQANTKIISVVDQMLEELVNLKR